MDLSWKVVYSKLNKVVEYVYGKINRVAYI